MLIRLSLLLGWLAAHLLAQNALYLDLSGPWAIREGDDPAWASPQLDDREWRRIGVPLPEFGPTGISQEIAGIQGGFWLRRSVELPPGFDGTRLQLTLGAIRDGYEVFINGQRVAATLDRASRTEATMPQPRQFAIPAGIVVGPSVLIALRVDRGVVILHRRWRLDDRGPYLLTYQDHAPFEFAASQWDRRFRRIAPSYLFGGLLLSMGLLSLGAWWMERKRRELLWFAAFASAHGWGTYYFGVLLDASTRPFNDLGVPVVQIALTQLTAPLLGEFALAALGVRAGGWWRLLFWGSYVAMLWGLVFGQGGNWPLYYGATLSAGTLFGLAVRGGRERADSWEERLLRGALALAALAVVENFIRRMLGVPNWIPVGFDVGRYQVDRDDLFALLVAAAMLTILLRRILADRQEKQRLVGELEAAGVIERLLLRETALAEPGLTLDAVYAPAQEVGGDFYYVLDGQLVVAGDVSGKGLKAAMVVSLVVGVLRETRERTPGAVLRALNRALAGQMEGGFVTCCCVRLDGEGKVIVACAGQMGPYVDGVEVPMDTGLPLGILGEAEFEETELTLGAGQQLTLVSDGVVEAANEAGELFGFERTRAVSRRTAGEIAAAAKAWGQNDDITVVTVGRA